MNKLILFSTKQFRQRAETTALDLCDVFDEIILYDDNWLKTNGYIEKHKVIFSNSIGFGYWIWKPIILLDSIRRSDAFDKILYVDCGDKIENSIIQHLNSSLSNGNSLCLTKGRNEAFKYTKRDCFHYMDCDNLKAWNSIQIEAGVISFSPSNSTEEIFKQWYKFCSDIRIVSNNENVCGKNNLDGFIAHRNDQSVLNNLKEIFHIEESDILRESITCNVL